MPTIKIGGEDHEIRRAPIGRVIVILREGWEKKWRETSEFFVGLQGIPLPDPDTIDPRLADMYECAAVYAEATAVDPKVTRKWTLEHMLPEEASEIIRATRPFIAPRDEEAQDRKNAPGP